MSLSLGGKNKNKTAGAVSKHGGEQQIMIQLAVIVQAHEQPS